MLFRRSHNHSLVWMIILIVILSGHSPGYAQISNVVINPSPAYPRQHSPSIIVYPPDTNKLIVAAYGLTDVFADRFSLYHSSDRGANWIRQPYLFHPHDGNYQPVLAIAPATSTIWCAYVSRNAGSAAYDKNGIYAIRSTDGGVIWSDQFKDFKIVDHDVPVNTGTVLEGEVALATSGSQYNTVHAAWTSQYKNGTTKKKVSFSSLSNQADDGASFPNGTILFEDGSNVYDIVGPAIGTDNYFNSIHLIVIALRGDGRFVLRYSSNSGASFYDAVEFPSAPIIPIGNVSIGTELLSANSYPSIAVRSLSSSTVEFYIVWASKLGTPPGNTNVYFMRGSISNQSISLHPEKVINTGSGNNWSPRIVRSPDKSTLHVVYYSQTPGTAIGDVIVASTRDYGSTFYHTKVNSVPLTSFPSTTGDYIGLTSTDWNVYPIWSDFRNSSQDIFMANYAIKPITVKSRNQSGLPTAVSFPKLWNGTDFTGPWSGISYRTTLFPTEVILAPFYPNAAIAIQAGREIVSNQKYRDWLGIEDVSNHKEFLVYDTDEATALFYDVYSHDNDHFAFRNVLIDNPSVQTGSINFSDPWYIDPSNVDYQDPEYGNVARNLGAGALWVPQSSPFHIRDHPEYQGVFLDQMPSLGPHYKVSADQTITNGSHHYNFLKWDGPSGIVLPSTSTGPVVFTTTGNIEARALYKGHRISTTNINVGSQSKLAKLESSSTSYALAYESGGDIWYSKTSDGGNTWSPEVLISNGDGKASNPSISSYRTGAPLYAHYSIIAWEENPHGTNGYQIWAKVKSEDYSTSWGPFRITSNQLNRPPVASVSASNTYIFWKDLNGIQYTNFSTWQDYPPKYTVPGTANAISFGADAPMSGKLKVVWASASDGIQYSKSTDGGASWSLPITLEGNYANIVNDQPVVTSDINDDGCIAWVQTNTTTETGGIKFLKIDLANQIFVYSTFPHCAGTIPSNPSISGHRLGNSTDVSLVWSLPNKKTAAALYRNGVWCSPFLISSAAQNIGISKSDNVETNTNRMLISFGSAPSAPYPILLTQLPNAQAPEHPLLSLPSQGAQNVITTPSLSWGCVFGASTYQLQVSTNESFSNLILDQIGITGTIHTASNLAANTQYWWRVRAINSNGQGAFSTAWSFTTTPNPPPAPPSLDKSVYNTHPKLTWTRVGSGITYKLYRYICEDYQDCTAPTSLKYQGTDTTYTDVGLVVGGTHDPTMAWYYVTATNGNGASPNSNKKSFNLDIEIAYGSRPDQIIDEESPNIFSLGPNYPNPFNPKTRIEYTLPQSVFVSIRIFNTFGESVHTVVNEHQSAGFKSVEFDASLLPSGVYFYRIQAGQFSDTRKMILIK